MFRRFAPLLLVSASLALARGALADTQYVLRMGRDTLAVERLQLAEGRAKGTLIVRFAGTRLEWVMTTGRDDLGRVVPGQLAVSQYALAAADTAQPQQRAVFAFAGDSVRMLSAAGPVKAWGEARGAWPYANPSMAMLACALRGARPSGSDSVVVPLFSVAGALRMRAVVRALPGDSLRVDLAGVQMRFARDANGLLAGGSIPTQGITLDAEVVTSGEFYHPPARVDYGAPPGAPYTAESVRVPVPGGFHLAGTLTVPANAKGPVPCALTLSGSGLEDRDEALPIVPGYRPFRQIADALARQGVATLRLDDRGFGDSGGDPSQATTADFADDARSALAWLRARRDIDGKRLVLIGHSEGGLVAPLVAAGPEPGVRAIVLIAAPSRDGRRVIESQARRTLAAVPGLDGPAREERLRESMARTDSIALQQAWLRWFLAHDPLPVAKRVRVPVLIVQGATDQQVEAVQANELAAALRAGGNRDVTVQLLPGVNHLLLEDPIGDPASYHRLPEREIRPAVLALIGDWLARRLR